ncbi:hypothetical protein [Actinomadura sp. HBU206391]|uniref:hypothetical protein n=1 Tax=Actinomadura sp. HBU206391 TaxID=2731692 RepID=UPI0016502921|nr:hypothetical protein [Actinomadura sp. HBU206391]MBC6460046.1 hypothetical protein [Actinomadura sp. HBU206391]
MRSADPEPADGHRSITYQAEQSGDLNERAATTAEVTLLPDELEPDHILVTGPCPACGGPMTHVEPLAVISRDLHPGDQASRVVDILCACGNPHLEAPDGETGCGRLWSLFVEWGP